MAPPVQTACPNCGHSPIGDEEERCPRCAHWLRELPRHHQARAERHVDAEQDHPDAFLGTRIGGPDLITSDAEANPGTAALALGALALFLLACGLGLFPATGSPLGYLALGGGDAILATLLVSYPGLGRPLVQLFSVLQAVGLVVLASATGLGAATLSLAVAPLVVLLGVAGEPGAKRRGLSLCLVVACLLYSGPVRIGSRYLGARGPTLQVPEIGLGLQLPLGFTPLSHVEGLTIYMALPGLEDPQLTVVPFADPQLQIGGLWAIAPAGRYEHSRLAQGFAEAMNPREGAAKPGGSAIAVRGAVAQMTYERRIGPDRRALVTGVKLADDRTAVLVVAAPSTELESVRQAIAKGTLFTLGEK